MEQIYKELQERLKFFNELLMDMTPKVNSEYTNDVILNRISELKFILSYIKQKIK